MSPFQPVPRAPRSVQRRTLILVVAVALVVVGTAISRAVQESTEPVAFKPDPALRGRAIEVPRGTTLLFGLIQRLADFTGRPTYYLGTDSLDATIPVERALAAVDLQGARELLDQAGYDLSEELYRGDKVLWVQRRIETERRRGGLRREEEIEAAAPARASTDPVAVFERRDGDGARFLVTFEAGTREEAENAALLLKSLQRGKDR